MSSHRTLKPCRANQYRNPKTNRCVKIATRKTRKNKKMMLSPSSSKTAAQQSKMKFNHDLIEKDAYRLLDLALTPSYFNEKIANKSEIATLTKTYDYLDGKSGIDICKHWIQQIFTDCFTETEQSYIKITTYRNRDEAVEKAKLKLALQRIKAAKKPNMKLNDDDKAINKLYKLFLHIFLNDYNHLDGISSESYQFIGAAIMIDGYKYIEYIKPDHYPILSHMINILKNYANNNYGEDRNAVFIEYLMITTTN